MYLVGPHSARGEWMVGGALPGAAVEFCTFSVDNDVRKASQHKASY